MGLRDLLGKGVGVEVGVRWLLIQGPLLRKL